MLSSITSLCFHARVDRDFSVIFAPRKIQVPHPTSNRTVVKPSAQGESQRLLCISFSPGDESHSPCSDQPHSGPPPLCSSLSSSWQHATVGLLSFQGHWLQSHTSSLSSTEPGASTALIQGRMLLIPLSELPFRGNGRRGPTIVNSDVSVNISINIYKDRALGFSMVRKHTV